MQPSKILVVAAALIIGLALPELVSSRAVEAAGWARPVAEASPEPTVASATAPTETVLPPGPVHAGTASHHGAAAVVVSNDDGVAVSLIVFDGEVLR